MTLARHIHWGESKTDGGAVAAAAGPKGQVHRIWLPGEGGAQQEVLRRWGQAPGAVEVHKGDRSRRPAALAVRRALTALTAFLEGRGRDLEFSITALEGTAFQRAVWDVVADIPWGEVRTYGEVAASIGQPTAVRAVGAANGANPLPLIVPCHRVIGAGGRLTGFGGGVALKARLLRAEGFEVTADEPGGRVRCALAAV